MSNASEYAIKTILTANDAQLKAAFGDAGSAVAKLGKKLADEAEKSTSKWHKFKEGFGEAFKFGGAAKLGSMAAEKIMELGHSLAEAIPQFAERAEQIGRTSEKLGLSAEYYQRLSYAMKMTDIPAETMERSFKKLNVGFAQLQKGQGPIEAGLKRLDPALMANIRRSGSAAKAFEVTADAIKKTLDPAKRAAIAQAVFGKGGQDMIPILLRGADGIREVMNEADKYGSILTDKAVGAGEKFSDNLKKLKGTAQSLADTGLSILVEKLNPIADKMMVWIGANRELIATKIGAVINGIGKAIEFITRPGVIEGIVALAVGIKAVSLATMLMGAGNPWVIAIAAIATLITLIVANWDKITGFFDIMLKGAAAVPKIDLPKVETSRGQVSMTREQGYRLGLGGVAPNAGAIGVQSNVNSITQIRISGLPQGMTAAATTESSTDSSGHSAPGFSGYPTSAGAH